MSNKPASIDDTIALLKIQGLLAGAYELSRNLSKKSPETDMKFLSYLIKMARMEAGACFETADPAQVNAKKPNNLDRM
ncbi:hypothetical protein WNZ14_11910 [Hoeflea sp. AS60]|uniref:hypothetical protein n=1 Tax=Hoeflea sp. AS60 TaxID=3135780 RepID=UPI00317192B3